MENAISERQEKINAGIDMIFLASCSLHGNLPDKQRLAQMNLKNVYRMAKRHSMQAIVYIVIAKCRTEYGEDIIDAELFEKWKHSYHEVLNRLVRFDLEREALCSFLDKNGIWYLPLKGVILQNYYPTLGMRQMADNDILVDPSARTLIRKFMENRGYTTESYNMGCHDVYYKGNISFEIHRQLSPEEGKFKPYFEYYCNVKDRLVSAGRPSELKFTDEDFYVYFIFHSYKHFSKSGCGIRTLLDIYVYLLKNSSTLSFDYIQKELQKLGIADFEKKAKGLAFKIFSPDIEFNNNLVDGFDEEDKEMLYFLIGSGTFGTFQQGVNSDVLEFANGEKVTRMTKIRFLMKRLFPDREHYKLIHPKAGKYIVAIPFLWVARIFRNLKKAKRWAKEFKYVNKYK